MHLLRAKRTDRQQSTSTARFFKFGSRSNTLRVFTAEEYRRLMEFFLKDFADDANAVLRPISGAKYCNADRVLARARPMLQMEYRAWAWWTKF